jgi:hypothetical protein
MYAIYGNIYHQYTPNVSIYTIHGSYGYIYIYTCKYDSSIRSIHMTKTHLFPAQPELAPEFCESRPTRPRSSCIASLSTLMTAKKIPGCFGFILQKKPRP